MGEVTEVSNQVRGRNDEVLAHNDDGVGGGSGGGVEWSGVGWGEAGRRRGGGGKVRGVTT